MDNNFLAFIGIAFLFIAALDLLHTLAFKGMGVFPNVSANLATQLWIAMRYLFAFSLLIPLLFIRKRIKPIAVLLGYTIITVFLILSVFYWNIFPTAYADSVGLTVFKVGSEYAISIILAVGIALLVNNRKQFSASIFRLLLLAMITAIATEMAFTLYTDVYGIANMVGHLLDFFSFCLIYIALVETGYTKPYDLLFRNLKQSENALRESEREQKIMVDFLGIANRSQSTNELVSSTLNFFKEQSGCEAVGIRLKRGEDFPYYETKGFSQEHIEFENKLCVTDATGHLVLDSEGNPVLECMCGNIIYGRFDPSKKFFTNKGSFWTNSTTTLLATTTDADRQAHTRNRCNGEGYESVALIPLIVGNGRLGLIQLNDKRKDMFKPETIAMWERIADHLALALSKTIVEDDRNRQALELKQTQLKLEEKAAEVEEYASQMEELAEQRAKKLQDAERLAAIGATAGMVGHDLKNPLQVIISELYFANKDILKLPESDEKQQIKDSLNEILTATTYMNKIILDLQDYARPLKPEYVLTDLPLLVDSVLKMVTLPANIRLSKNIENTAELRTDPLFIKRALTNLVNNAIQAMPTGGTLEVKGYRTKDTVYISVSDTGIGIPEEIKPKLFTPMMTTKSKGQGFGLAVVKRLIEAQNGTVTFESEVGKGTKFIIGLPATA